MSEKKKNTEKENVHEQFEREMQEGTRQRRAFANKEDGLHVDYDESEFNQFLPHLYGEIKGTKKSKKISISAVREEEEIEGSEDLGENIIEEEFEEEIISEEEHLRDYFEDLKSKSDNKTSEENVNNNQIEIKSDKDIYRAKREAMEKILQQSTSPSVSDENNKNSQKIETVSIKEPLNYSKIKRTKEEIIAITKGKASYHTEENDELFNPNIVGFLRRCQKDEEAQEIIDYMLKKGEISKDDAEKYTKQLKEQGLRSFGSYKAPGYYEREFPRIQTERSRKFEWDSEEDNFSSSVDDDDEY